MFPIIGLLISFALAQETPQQALIRDVRSELSADQELQLEIVSQTVEDRRADFLYTAAASSQTSSTRTLAKAFYRLSDGHWQLTHSHIAVRETSAAVSFGRDDKK